MHFLARGKSGFAGDPRFPDGPEGLEHEEIHAGGGETVGVLLVFRVQSALSDGTRSGPVTVLERCHGPGDEDRASG